VRPTIRDGDIERMTRRCLADRPRHASMLHAVVMHAGGADRAARLQARLRDLDGADVVVGPFGPAMVTHTGAGLLGLAWWWDGDGDQNRTG
jgi:fatty acid-binding protein DegV